jgi:GT2 family glycosyltransferase
MFKYNAKITIRGLLPKWFLELIRQRQVPLNKMMRFKKEFEGKKVNEPTRVRTIAIIVPCYNHSKFLSLTFRSIINQTRLPDQVILIDDCSRDQTSEVIRGLVSDYQKNNPEEKIEFIVRKNEKNLGQALSINRATGLATTDVVMILNDDDYLMHDAIEISLRMLRDRKDLALIGFGNINFDNDNFLETSKKRVEDHFSIKDISLQITTPSDALGFEDFCSLNMTHSGSTFSRKKALSVGLYRNKKDRLVRFSDRDFQIRMNLLYSVGTDNKIPICFWRTNSSVDSGKNS